MRRLRHITGASPMICSLSPDESDDVYPLFTLDTNTYRRVVLWWMLRFNDVLDAVALHASLSRLLEIGDWRKLGGRLRSNVNGELELHVPRPFTAKRPALTFTRQVVSTNIEDHRLASTLPEATEAPSIQPGPRAFQGFAVRNGAPVTLKDLINQDIPQLSLHVTTFENATLVGLSWPHTLMDVMGQHALLHCWSLMLAGRRSEVPPVLGAREDVICAALGITAGSQDETRNGPYKRMSKMEKIVKCSLERFRCWFALAFEIKTRWDLLKEKSSEAHTIFIPSAVMVKLHRQARNDIISLNSDQSTASVSEGDVLTAWATRAVALSLPAHQPVTIVQVVDARFRVSLLAQSPGVYIQNMIVAASIELSADTARGPLGSIAMYHRRCLEEQLTEHGVLALLRTSQQEGEMKSNTKSLVCNGHGALFLPFTNWTRANLFETVDFSPSITRIGDKRPWRYNPPGTMLSHHIAPMRGNAEQRYMIQVAGKDSRNNYWLTALLPPLAWKKVEEDIELWKRVKL